MKTWVNMTAALCLMSGIAIAGNNDEDASILAVNQHNIADMREYLEEEYGLDVEDVSIDRHLGAPLVAFNTSSGMLYYSTDFSHVITGDIHDIDRDWLNISSLSSNRANADLISSIRDSAIVYSAPTEKHRIYVFTDADCPYCTTMHEEIADYLSKGISLYVFAAPLEGDYSDGAIRLAHAWCSENQTVELNKVMRGETTEEHTNAQCRATVNDHLTVANELGLDGTPAIVFDNGSLQLGYHEVDEVVAMLDALPR